MQNYEYILSLRDNVSAALQGINNNANRTQGIFSGLMGKMFAFNQIKDFASNIYEGFNSISEPARKFETAMADIKASTGVNSEQLKAISDNARELGKTYGVDITEGVGAAQTILSKLSPELAKSPEVLKGMTEASVLLSKTMKNDLAGATGVLTDSMNAYGISLKETDNPQAKMLQMSDMIVASFKVGSAEVADISAGMKTLGATSAMAGVSYAESLALLQVLDSNGLKKGAEGGTALRNVLLKLGEGNLMPPSHLKILQQAGVSMSTLTDKTATATTRLAEMQKLSGAQLGEIFGKENVVGAQALINNLPKVDQFTQEIARAGGATKEYANIMSQTFDEKIKRLQSIWQDFVIEIWNGSKPITDAFTSLGAIFTPLIASIANTFGLGDTTVKSFVATVVNGFAGIINFITPAISLIVSALSPFIEGLAVMANFIIENISWISTLALALGAIPAVIYAINFAMALNPVGLIIAGIALVIGLVKMAYENFEGFRIVVAAVGDAGKMAFDAIGDALDWVLDKIKFVTDGIKDVFGIAESGVDGMNDVKKASTIANSPLKLAPALSGNNVLGNLGNLGLGGSGAKALVDISKGKDALGIGKKENIDLFASVKNDKSTLGGAEGKKQMESINGGGNKPTTINIKIEKFQDNIQLYATTVTEGIDRIREIMEEELLRIANGVQQKMA